MYIRASQGHAGKIFWYMDVLSHKDSKRTRTMSVSYWILEKRRFKNIRRICTRRFRHKQRQESSAQLIRVAIGSIPRPKAQALRSHQELSWSIFCDQPGGGAWFAGFLPNNERECPTLRHNSGRGFLDNEDGSAQFVKDEIERRSVVTIEKTPARPREAEENFLAWCKKTSEVALKAVPLGKISRTAEVIREIKKAAKCMFIVIIAPKEPD